MVFEVQIAVTAEQDIAAAVAFIHSNSPTAAQKWLGGLSAAFQSLEEMPYRFAIIREAEEVQRSLRSLPHHSHRIVYEINEDLNIVTIVRVYHSARAPLKSEDLETPHQ